MKNLIVISDFRSVPVIAALSAYRQLRKHGDAATLVVSRRLISNHEYGDPAPTLWKMAVSTILRLFFR